MSDDFPFRIETLLTQCGGNREVSKVILEEFIIQVGDDMKELEQCITDGDLAKIGKLGHRLKGTAGVLGATNLHALCLTLEIAGKEGNTDKVAQTYPELKAEADRCVAAVPDAQKRL